MKFSRMKAFALAAAALAAATSAAAQEFKLEASQIEWVGDSVRAVGNVRMLAAEGTASADEAWYNWTTGQARLTKSAFTTCASSRPDYRIEADSLTLVPPNLLRARGVSLFLGRTRIMKLRSLKARVGARSGSFNIFPRISSDSESGLALAYNFTLADTARLLATSEVKATTRDGVQADFHGILGLDGALGPTLQDPLSYASFRDNALEVPTPPSRELNAAADSAAGQGRLRLSARFASNIRTYNVRDENLLVNRRPEIGLTYAAREVGYHQPVYRRLRISPSATASWGRFSEAGRTAFTDRTSIVFILPVNIGIADRRTALQPAVEFSRFGYGSGGVYTRRAYSLGISHLRQDGCLISLRYTARSDSGETPFAFDRLQVTNELMGSIQGQRRRWLAGISAGLDADSGSVYDWSAMLGHRTDCLVAAVTWSQLEHKLQLDLRLASR